MTAKKHTSPRRSAGNSKKQRRRGGVIATAVIAGALVGPAISHAALTPPTEQAAYEAALSDGTLSALKQFLQKHPTSRLAEPVFLKLAAMCGGGAAESDPDCTGSVRATAHDSDPPDFNNPPSIY